MLKMKDSEVENVIITAATYVKQEMHQLLEDIRKEREQINAYVGLDKQLTEFLKQKTSAKDVITAINVLLQNANQSPVNEVTLCTILDAAEVIRINKSDSLFNARLVHSANGIIVERYVPAEKFKKHIIDRIRERFDGDEIRNAEKRLGSLDSLSIQQLRELKERLLEKKQKVKVKSEV